MARDSEDDRSKQDLLKTRSLEAQLRLLVGNAATGVVVTITASALLAYIQSYFIDKRLVVAWFIYMFAVAAGRLLLARRYFSALPGSSQLTRWNWACAAATGLTGLGWGGAGFLLYPESQLTGQILLVFVIGGMMLGAASLLAARPQAFLAFLLPSGLLPAIRMFLQGDREHITMGLLAALFTVAVVFTTWRLHRTIAASIDLRFQNQDLIQDLQAANRATENLNQQLELRVRERTAELETMTHQLVSEMEQRKEMEEELLRTRKLESLGVLAGGIAHDFNNFLTVILGNVELAKMELRPDEPVQEILEQTSNACQRAALLSSQLLTFAKGGAPIRRVTSVAKIIREGVQLARAGAPVTISVTIPEDLWSADIDAGQIGQVLHNILLNARQAMGDGGRIEVAAENILCGNGYDEQTAPHIRISIRDYGPGIPEEILTRIFDPYFTRKPGGSGLGLATAHAIVSKHEGKIHVESKTGEGTIFTIELPASGDVSAPDCASAPLRAGRGRVLVMDDEESVRMLADRVLTSLGYEVQSAGDGAEALALYEAGHVGGRPFDAVVLDLTVIGGMGGLETAARLKKLDPSAKLIVSSGYSDSAVMSRFHEYGFRAVIPKPWNAALLSEVVARVLVGTPEAAAD